MAGRYGDILSSLSIGAGQSVRRNAGDNGWEAYTPSAGSGLTIGDAVTGGGANRVLYEDGSQNLATDADFYFTSDELYIGAARVGEWSGGGGYAVFGHKTAITSSAYNYAVLQSSGGATYFNTASGGELHFRIGNSDKFIIYDGYTAFNATADSAVAFWLEPAASNKFGLLIRGKASQSNPLFEVRDSANVTRAQIDGNYRWLHGYDGSNYWTATVASNGAVTFDAVGSGAKFTFSDDVEVPDEAYGAGWNGSTEVPTKNALYDKIETISAGGVSDGDKGDVAVSGSGTVWSVESATMVFDSFKLAQETSGFTLTINSEADDFTANRTLSIVTGDADRLLTIGGDTTLNGGTHSGTNTGDQTLNGLLPTQTGNNGKVLQTDGSNTSWQTVSGLTQPQVMARALGC